MEFIPAPNVAQVEVRGTLDGAQVENVLYFLAKPPPVTPASINALASDIASFWAANAIPLLNGNYTFREVYATDLSSITGPTATASGGGLTGTRTLASGSMPNSNTICVSFRTAQRGRSHRGRNYWAGLARGDVLNNVVTAGFITALTACYNTLKGLTEDNTIPWYWVVLSRRANKAWRPQGLTTTITDVLVVDATIDSQRRRLPGRGN